MSEQLVRTPDSLTANSPDSLLDVVGGPCSTLQPISEDKEHHLQLEVPAVLTPPQPRDLFSAVAAASPTVSDDEPSTGMHICDVFLRSCLCFGRRKTVPERDPFGIVHKVHLYVPPGHREPKITAKLIKVSTVVLLSIMNSA